MRPASKSNPTLVTRSAVLEAVTGRSTDEAEMAALMRAAQEGDAAAYARLLTAITPMIRRLAAGRWTGSDQADDVVQDVLLSGCIRFAIPTIRTGRSSPG